LLGAKSFSVKAPLQPDGTATFPINRAGLTPLACQLALDLAGSERITGTIIADGVTLLCALDRAVFDAKTNPCLLAAIDPKTGKRMPTPYTMALQRDPTRAADHFPAGHGFGVATVKPDGSVRFAGTLGDNTPGSQSSLVSKTGGWPFHAVLYRSGGVLTGDLFFRETPTVSDLDGTLTWIKPPPPGTAPIPPTATYPAGFTGRTEVVGARYVKTQPIGPAPGTVTFGGGGLTPLAPVGVAIDANGTFTGGPTGFSLRFTAGTGLFNGTFLEPGATKARSFRGALLQKTGRGYSEFGGAPLTGGGLSTGFVELVIGP
jgi:hypothetical protein